MATTRGMFSDRARGPKIIVAVVALLSLSVHYTRFAVAQRASIGAAFEDPVHHDGMQMVFSLWEITHISTPNMYSISKTVRGVSIEGPTEGLKVGDTVTIKGTFRASDRRVVVRETIPHPLRRMKGMLSILALVAALIAAPRWFGVESGRVVVRG